MATGARRDRRGINGLAVLLGLALLALVPGCGNDEAASGTVVVDAPLR